MGLVRRNIEAAPCQWNVPELRLLLENIASHHAVSGVDGFANQGHTVARSKTGQVARRDI
jgi:hypothetical protein